MALIVNLDAAQKSISRGEIPFHSVSLASFDRPGDTTAYTSGDVYSDSAVAEDEKAIVFPDCARKKNGSGAIVGASLSLEDVDATVAWKLYIFDAEPTNFIDNDPMALLAADLPILVAVYSFAAGGIDLGVTSTYVATVDGQTALPTSYVCESTSTNLYGILEVFTGYTPSDSSKVHLRLQLIQD